MIREEMNTQFPVNEGVKKNKDNHMKEIRNRPAGVLSEVNNDSLSQLIEGASCAVFVCTVDTDELLYVNEEAKTLFGAEAKELIGKKCHECLMQQQTPCCFCKKEEMKQKLDQDITLPVNGNVYHIVGKKIEWNGIPAYAHYAVPAKPTDETLLYKSIVANSNTAIYIAEKHTRKVIFVNAAWMRLYRLPEGKEVMGKVLFDVLSESEILFTPDELNQLSNERYSEFHKTSLTGKYLHVWAKSVCWSGQDSYICYLTDETAMWDNHQQLQKIIDRVPGGIVIYEITGEQVKATFTNKAYYQMIGDTREARTQYWGDQVVKAVKQEDLPIINDAIGKVRDGENMIDIHFRVLNGNQKYTWVRLVGAVVGRTKGTTHLYCSFSDFDEFMRTQQELKSNGVVLNEALQNAKVSAWKLDIKKHRITFPYGVANEREDKKLEDVMTELIQIGKMPEETVQICREVYTDVFKGERREAEIRILNKEKTKYCWKRIIYTPVFNRRGELIEAVGTSIDITEQKEKEQAYEDQIKLKKQLIKNTLVTALYNLTRNSITKIDCKPMEELTEIANAKTVDESLRAIRKNALNEAEKIEFQVVRDHHAMLETYSHGKQRVSIRHHLKETTRWLESDFEFLDNPYTKDVEAIVVIKDITSAVRTEQIVNTLVTTDYEAIMTIDAATGAALPFIENQSKIHNGLEEIVTFQQDMCDNVAGVEAYARKYCLPNEIEDVIRENSLIHIKEVLEKQTIHLTLYALQKDGELFYKRTMYAYLETDKQTILCAVQDVTDTYNKDKMQKERLAQALKSAEYANRTKTEFFSRMSHDMRTPMNGILGLTALSEQEDDVQVLKQNMRKIQESGRYLLSLINDTLDFQRMESGKMKLEPQVVHCQTLVDTMVDMIQPSIQKKNLNLEITNINMALDCYVRIDPVRMKQIFVNLLSNAIKFTPEGGTIRIINECKEREDRISHDEFRISDTGIGMSKEFLEQQIFQPFSQEYNQVSAQYTGSGLGLSIVRSLVELMGGTISVESEQNVGTTFTICLDIERVEKEDGKQDVNENAKGLSDAMQQLNGCHILLVEDHPLNAEITMKLLEKVGCEVVWKSNGAEGVQYFEQSEENSLDAILMDIRMPVMDGLTAAKEIRSMERQDAKAIPIMAMTANAYEEDVEQTRAAGMNEHLAKPIDPKKLYETIARCI